MSHLKYFNPNEESPSAERDRDANSAAAALLADLENRQDHVIAELERLNIRIEDVLRELGVSLDENDQEGEQGPWHADLDERALSCDSEQD